MLNQELYCWLGIIACVLVDVKYGLWLQGLRILPQRGKYYLRCTGWQIASMLTCLCFISILHPGELLASIVLFQVDSFIILRCVCNASPFILRIHVCFIVLTVGTRWKRTVPHHVRLFMSCQI